MTLPEYFAKSRMVQRWCCCYMQLQGLMQAILCSKKTTLCIYFSVLPTHPRITPYYLPQPHPRGETDRAVALCTQPVLTKIKLVHEQKEEIFLSCCSTQQFTVDRCQSRRNSFRSNTEIHTIEIVQLCPSHCLVFTYSPIKRICDLNMPEDYF